MDKFHSKKSPNRACRGFTLVELLVTMVVAGIVLTIAIPSLHTMMQSNRAATQANDLITTINLARSEAAKTGSAVCICASANQASCSGATEWKNGWIIYRDPTGTCPAPAANSLVRVNQGLAGAAALTGPASVVYQPTGTAPVSSFSLTITGYCGGSAARTINISATGRPSITQGDC